VRSGWTRAKLERDWPFTFWNEPTTTHPPNPSATISWTVPSKSGKAPGTCAPLTSTTIALPVGALTRPNEPATKRRPPIWVASVMNPSTATSARGVSAYCALTG